MNPLASLFCVAENVVTDKRTDNTHTHTQTKYHNPRCTCMPRVNELTNVRLVLHAQAAVHSGSDTTNNTRQNKHDTVVSKERHPIKRICVCTEIFENVWECFINLRVSPHD